MRSQYVSCPFSSSPQRACMGMRLSTPMPGSPWNVDIILWQAILVTWHRWVWWQTLIWISHNNRFISTCVQTLQSIHYGTYGAMGSPLYLCNAHVPQTLLSASSRFEDKLPNHNAIYTKFHDWWSSPGLSQFFDVARYIDKLGVAWGCGYFVLAM